MFIPRSTAVASILVLAVGIVHAQETAAPFALETPASGPQDVSNWSAPPFWIPPRTTRAAEEGGLRAQAVEVLPSGPLPFVAIAPCRLLDTRPPANNPLDGDGLYTTDEIRTYTLPGACGLPAGIQAVSLNVTATNTGAGAFGHVKVWPADGTEPNVSTLNYPGAGTTVANAAVVPLSSAGAMKVKSGNTGADVILDVNGYYGDNFDSLYVNEGQLSSVTSAMITNGAIADEDVNASASIADTKLATIATAGKVADTALSANVTKLGQTIEATEITNVERSINVPLLSLLDCESATIALIDFTSGTDNRADFDATGPGSGGDGVGFNLHFDNSLGFEDQNSEICSQLVLPQDYASGGHFRVLAKKPMHSGDTEVLTCAAGRNLEALGTPGTVEVVGIPAAHLTCAPSLAGLTAGDTLRFNLSITSSGTMNDLVKIWSVAFVYTASQ